LDTAWGPVDAVVVAVSTGGPNALATLVAALPAGLPTPVLIVQHMPPMFTAMLAARLDGLGPLTVTEAADGEPITAGHVYVAPGGRHLALRRDGHQVLAVVHDGPLENSCRPAADVLFRAAAEVYGSGTLAVVMTGMGRDGLRGTEAIVAAGGSALAQDQQSSVVGSMPGAVADAGLAEAVLPLDEIAVHIVRRTARPRAQP
jgi:two-component system chemotaxis response regulator CheB